MPALECQAVTAGYGERPVLHEVSLSVGAGEMVAVLGPNGAGKSTLVRVLAGTLAASSGSVRLDGRALGELSRGDVARALGVVPQETEVAFGFDVRQVVMMGRAPHQTGLLLPRRADLEAVEQALERCELTALGARSVGSLSGGERRRVTIARVLAQKPRVLLLDEPAAHLDIRHAEQMYALAREEIAERRVACLAVVHDLNAAARWADRIVVLHQGRVRASGTVDEVLDEPLLEEVFGLPIRAGRDGGLRYFVPARHLSK